MIMEHEGRFHEKEKKRRWLESVVNVLYAYATDRFSSYHYTNEKLIAILDVSKKLRN